MRLGTVEVGAGQPCRFIAEVSCNHNGSLDRALRLIDAAKAAGADIVKFQAYTPDELVALRGDGPAPDQWGEQGWSMRDLYTKAQTPLDWFPALVLHCQQIGMPWFSSVFGPDSLAVLEEVGCPAYKIARLDNDSDVLADMVAATGRPMVVSEAERGERAVVAGDQLVLYCPIGYPQSHIKLAHWKFAGPFQGFSYHGTDPLPCIVAATLGAKLIEVHFQLYAESSELESNISLTPRQFRTMVDTVRRVEGML